MIGWFVAWKCLVACLFLEESQQPTCPHSRQRRKCTHVSPVFKQSSQPFALGVPRRIWSRCVHCLANVCSFLEEFWELRRALRCFRLTLWFLSLLQYLDICRHSTKMFVSY